MKDFRRLPKIDLHLHLDGAIRTRTILELGLEHGVPLPAKTVKALEKHVTVAPSCRSLPDFLGCFGVYLPVLKTPASMKRIAYELCADQAEDGVVYFEARYAPILQEFAPEASVEAVLEGLRRGSRDFRVRCALILCALRDQPPPTSLATARLAARYRDRGVVGFDIANDERVAATPHAAAFRHARRHGLGITVHAGEAGPASNIREAIDLFGATRIGHGLQVAGDPALMEYAFDRGITFEMCLTSNLQTRGVRTIRDHPFPKLLRSGLRVTLNTDDPAVSRITLSHEYGLAARAFRLGPKDFARLHDNAVEAAFAPESLKRTLRI